MFVAIPAYERRADWTTQPFSNVEFTQVYKDENFQEASTAAWDKFAKAQPGKRAIGVTLLSVNDDGITTVAAVWMRGMDDWLIESPFHAFEKVQAMASALMGREQVSGETTTSQDDLHLV